MINWLISLVFVISIFALGMVVDYYFLQRRGFKFAAGKFWGLGLGSVAIVQLVCFVVRVPVTIITVEVVTMVVFLTILVDRKLRMHLVEEVVQLPGKINVRKIAVFGLFAAGVFVLTFSETIWGHDALAFWVSKGRAFFVDSGISHRAVFAYWPYDYPLLWPLVSTWFYQFLGQSDLYFVRIIPFVTFMLIGVSLRKWWIQVVFFVTPFALMLLIKPEYGGNADLFVGFFVLLASYYLLDGEIMYSGIFLGLAALTKNDSLPLLLAFPIIAIIFLRHEKGWRSGIALALAVVALDVGFKWYFKFNNRYLDHSFASVLAARPIGKYMLYTVQSFREEFRQVYRWGLGWWLVIFMLLSHYKMLGSNRRILAVLILIGVFFGSLLWVYYVTPEDQASHIGSSLSRVLMQIYPTVLLLAATVQESTKKIMGVRRVTAKVRSK